MNSPDLELEDLIKNAQKQPGIADLMEVYGEASKILMVWVELINDQREAIVSYPSTSSGSPAPIADMCHEET